MIPGTSPGTGNGAAGGNGATGAMTEVQAITCIPVMPREECNANITASLNADRHRFMQLPEVGRRKSSACAIVAGGPSLLGQLEKVRTFPVVIACGTVHDFLVTRGIRPRYAVVFDPYVQAHDKHEPTQGSNLSYYAHLVDTCTYLISSHSEAKLFEYFAEVPHAIWHALGDADEAYIRGEPALSGGCTAALRAITIAVVLGYWDLHFFGLDSAYSEDQSHAYEMTDPLPEQVTVKLENSPREFKTNLAWIAQAQQFFKMVEMHGRQFRPSIHGDGMIYEMARLSQGRP